ncbi:nucleoside recognition domain-containing protein [Desulfuromonas carbonis]
MNLLWLLMICISIVFAIVTGHLDAFTKALFDGAKAAVEVSLYLLGIVSLWLGITRILEDAGLIQRIAHLFRPLICRLFKTIPGDHPSITAITLNVLANLFGLGNAATPLGIQAMQELETLNPEPGAITPEMMTFIVLNTASLQLIPFSVIGILASYGHPNPAVFVFPVLLATLISTMTALLVLGLFRRLCR